CARERASYTVVFYNSLDVW
nr:immunoglobulin heavy chain junction region [Macaca mulatta]MOV44207.1 immunoglobulin heavy chain junction region [Macaca mulatta]